MKFVVDSWATSLAPTNRQHQKLRAMGQVLKSNTARTTVARDSASMSKLNPECRTDEELPPYDGL